jgi:hypothetical protein
MWRLYFSPLGGNRFSIVPVRASSQIAAIGRTDTTQWATRSSSAAMGRRGRGVSRISRVFGLKSHETETFTSPQYPPLLDKVRDALSVKGLSLPWTAWPCVGLARPRT